MADWVGIKKALHSKFNISGQKPLNEMIEDLTVKTDNLATAGATKIKKYDVDELISIPSSGNYTIPLQPPSGLPTEILGISNIQSESTPPGWGINTLKFLDETNFSPQLVMQHQNPANMLYLSAYTNVGGRNDIKMRVKYSFWYRE